MLPPIFTHFLPYAGATTNLFVPIFLSCRKCYINKTKQFFFFEIDIYFSVSIVPLGTIQVVLCVNTQLLFIGE